jgi:hypothetical protein
MSRLERGTRWVSIDEVLVIAHLCRCDPASLIGRDARAMYGRTSAHLQASFLLAQHATQVATSFTASGGSMRLLRRALMRRSPLPAYQGLLAAQAAGVDLSSLPSATESEGTSEARRARREP